MAETSFQRANRLADESKALKWAAYEARGHWWQAVDWLAWVDDESTVSRPTEKVAMISLWSAQHRAVGRINIAATPVYDDRGVLRRMVCCTRCDTWQRAAAYGEDRRKRNGLKSWCRSCAAKYQLERYRPVA